MVTVESRKLGPNMTALLIRKVALDAIPPGGGLAAGMSAFTTPGKLARLHREALVWVDEAITVIQTAPDNPYGSDEEVIAGAILAELSKLPGVRDE